MFRPLLIVIAVIAAACTTPAATIRPTSPPTAAPTVAPPTTVGATVSVAAAGYFVGPNGMTLYTFDKDSLGTTVCSGDCLANWPALTVDSAGAITVGSGLVASDFAAITRPEGTSQVTFKQIPLYFFAADTVPGDTKGDGVGGVWHLATTASTLPTPAPPTASGPTIGPTQAVVTPAPIGDELVIGMSGSGGFLVDPEGFSLYTFDRDSPGASTCSGDCADNWPALTVGSGQQVVGGDGVTGTFATIVRDDGDTQVTYNDAPLYFYSGDDAPGDTAGDGIGDVWHLAQP